MGKSSIVWFALLLVAILLIITGFNGTFGQLLAVVFVPGDLTITGADNGGQSGGFSTTGFGKTTTTGATLGVNL